MRANFKGVLRTKNLIQAVFLANFMVATASYGTPVRKPVSHPTAPAYDTAACRSMTSDYELASKKLALNNALTKNERSQARVTQLASEDSVTITQANMTLGLMRDNHCPMPSYAPSAGRYVMQSMACSTALAQQSADTAFYRLQQTVGERAAAPSTDMPQQCDFNRWTAEDRKPASNSAPSTVVTTPKTIAAAPIAGSCPSCSAADDKMRLQRASDSSATTPGQRDKMSQIISAHTADGSVDWHAAAQEYFTWYHSLPYHP